MFENPRRGRQARNFTTNVPKILVLKSSSEQIFSRKLPLGAPELLVQLWAKITRRSQHGGVFCSQILFLSATVAFLTNFLSLADFRSDLSRTNLKLPSSATWP